MSPDDAPHDAKASPFASRRLRKPQPYARLADAELTAEHRAVIRALNETRGAPTYAALDACLLQIAAEERRRAKL